MRTTWTVRAWICGSALCLVHCDLNEPEPEGKSGVLRDKLLKEISDPEAEKLCVFNAKELGRAWTSEQTYCIAFTGDSLELTCQEEYEACVASDEFETLTTRKPPCAGYTKSRLLSGDDCDASVGDWEACVQTIYRAANEYYDGASCEMESDAVDDEEGVPETAECKALAKKCKNLGGESSNTE